MRLVNSLVSVIIPCWNAEAYVGEAIESALGQTYPNVEVIVVDDGSSDGSLEIIRSFGNRIRWETGPNRGACAARNRGLEIANGDLIQFLDADDLLHEGKLEKMAPMALSEGPKASPICDWTTELATGAGERAVIRPGKANGEDPVLFCLRSQLATPSPLHWKKNLAAVGGFEVSLSCSQERDLHLRLACNGVDFVHLPELLVLVRRQPNSISSDFRRILKAHGVIFERAFNRLRDKGALTEARRHAFATALARDGRLCLRHDEAELAQRYFALAKSMSREGSLAAFGRLSSRTIARTLGPIWAERFCQLGLAFGLRP